MVIENYEKHPIELTFKSNENQRKRIKPRRQDKYQKYICAFCGLIFILILWIIFGYITYDQIIKYHL